MKLTTIYLIAFSFFIIDLASNYLLEYQLLNALFCFLIFLGLSHKFTKSYAPIILLLGGIDLIIYGSSITSLCFYSAISVSLLFMQQHLNTSLKTVFYGVVALAILAKIIILDRCCYGLNTAGLYTVYEIFASLLVMFLLLKYTLKGKQGNRL